MQRKKTKKMTTYTVTINEKSKILVKLLEALSIAGATVEKKKNGLDESLEDIEEGRVYSAESVDDMFEQILGK